MSGVYTLKLGKYPAVGAFPLMKMQIFAEWQANLMKWWKVSFGCGGSLGEVLRRWAYYYYPQSIRWTVCLMGRVLLFWALWEKYKWKWVTCTPEHNQSLANTHMVTYSAHVHMHGCSHYNPLHADCSFELLHWEQWPFFPLISKLAFIFQHKTFTCKSLKKYILHCVLFNEAAAYNN